MAIALLDNVWSSWIQENLSRGCFALSLLNILLNHGFALHQLPSALNLKKDNHQAWTQPLRDDWRQWVQENLDKGCSLNEILTILQANGALKPSFSFGPDHQKLSQIRLTQSSVASKINSDLLQLYILEDFLSEIECQTLIDIMTQNLRPSTLTTPSPDKDYRTSKTSDLTQLQHPAVAALEVKIAQTLGINLSYSEHIQAQWYDVGEQFKVHTDYFEPNTPEFQQFGGTQGNRTWTFMIYLNDVPKGGGTHFAVPAMTYLPSRGKAIAWNNLLPDGRPNPNTRHAGLPVEQGYKAIVTKWFREFGSGSMFLDA